MAGAPLRVALTGGIATGKSHCLRVFAALDVPIIDADTLAHEAIAVGTSGYRQVVQRFGSAIIDADGVIDRRALGAIVFKDTAARADLESILHPLVYADIQTWFKRLAGVAFGIADIPLLYETRRADDFDKVIVVACPREVQVARVMKRDGLSREQADQRIASQLPIERKRELGDYVVDTDGSVEDTDQQIKDVWRDLHSACS